MKTLLLKITILVILVFGTLESVTVFTRHWASLYYKTSAYSAQADYSWTDRLEHPPKIVIMGSSTAHYGVSPTVMAKRAGLRPGEIVNLAEDARTPMQSYYIWTTLSRPVRESVRFVLYGFDPWIFYQFYYVHDDFAITQWNILQRLAAVFSGEVDSATKVRILGYGFLQNAFGQSARNALMDPSKGVGTGRVPDDFGAQKLTRHPKNFSSDACALFAMKKVYPVSGLYFSYLRKLKETLEAQGTKFMLFMPPRAQAWRDEYQKKCGEIEPEIMAKLTSELGPVRIIDGMDFSSTPERMGYMSDALHMNEDGQKAFSAYLAAKLSL